MIPAARVRMLTVPLVLSALGATACALNPDTACAPHPFDPPTGGEIRRAADVFRTRGELPPGARLAFLETSEPSKATVEAGETTPRVFTARLRDASGRLRETRVDLGPEASPAPRDAEAPPGGALSVRGGAVSWRRWRFHFSDNAREGLVLHRVRLADGEQSRPLLWRGSLAGWAVVYGDPDFPGGANSGGPDGPPVIRSSLCFEYGVSAPRDAVLLDTIAAGEGGEPRVLPRSVALYERDSGPVTDGAGAPRIARELVLARFVRLAEFDALQQWIFGEDGSLRVELALTGGPLPKSAPAIHCMRCLELLAGDGTEPLGADRYGTLVAPERIAPNFQCFFCYRLDLDVDGPRNSVCEVNVRPAPLDPNRPERVATDAFLAEECVLSRESVGARDMRVMSHRMWRIIRPEPTGPLGHFPGYMLEPGHAPMPLQADESPLRRQCRWIDHALWVTRFRDDERFASGDFSPRASKSGQAGLLRFVEDDESLAGEDVVVWHAFGLTHIPRPEDGPESPALRAGFTLLPKGFFIRNPAKDVNDSRAPHPGK